MSEPMPINAPRKGMSTLVKVLLGCGVLIVLGIGACVVVGVVLKKKFVDPALNQVETFAKDLESNPDAAAVRAAELALRLNPEIDVVSSNPESGTITVREKATGKETTFDLEDIKTGKFSIKSGDQETHVDVDASSENGGSMKVTTDQGTAVFGAGSGAGPEWIPAYPGARTDGLSTIESRGERSGSFTVSTTDAPDVLLEFYEEKLQAAGFSVQRASLSVDGAPSGTLTASAEKRTLSITAAAQEGTTQALVAYTEKP